MALPQPGASDLAIPSEIVKPDVRVHVTRIPYDDYFQLSYQINGRQMSEELDPDETRKWFTDRFSVPKSVEHGKQRDEMLGKALDECWNFYETWITIPGDVYVEPAKPFPHYQPQI